MKIYNIHPVVSCFNGTVDYIQVRNDNSLLISLKRNLDEKHYYIIVYCNKQVHVLHAQDISVTILQEAADALFRNEYMFNRLSNRFNNPFIKPFNNINTDGYYFCLFKTHSVEYLPHRINGPAITLYNEKMKPICEQFYVEGHPVSDKIPKIINGKIIPKCTLSEIMNIGLTFNREYAHELYKIYKKTA